MYALKATADLAKRAGGDLEHLLNVEALALSKTQTAVSHGSAVRWHELDHLWQLSNTPTVTRAAGNVYVTRKAVIRRAQLPENQVECFNGVRVTTVARTIADIARELPLLDATIIGNCALAKENTTRAEVASVLGNMVGWPGAKQANRMVEELDARAQSPLETLCRSAFVNGGLPPPELQVWVFDADGFVGIVDGMWIDRFVAYEADGDSKYVMYGHEYTVLDERRRHERLERCGIEVHRFCWREAWHQPSECVARIRTAFARTKGTPPPRARFFLVDRDTPAPHPHGDVGRSLPTNIGLRCVYDGLGAR